MKNEHHHSSLKDSKERPLTLALLLTLAFLLTEVGGGLFTGSLALISDAAHMLMDVTALGTALIAIKIGKRPADTKRTFGYYRFEILTTALNTALLFLVALYILFEAYQRLHHPSDIYTPGMLVIASVGLIVNLIAMWLLTPSKNKSLNMKSAYLEVWSDMWSSVGVIVGALILHFTGWVWIDSIISVCIGLWFLPRAWFLFRESINVLLESVPEGMDLNQLKESILKLKGVLDVHELHVWAVTSDKISLTAHVVVDEKYKSESILPILQKLLASQFCISHTTFQLEREKCLEEHTVCNFISIKK